MAADLMGSGATAAPLPARLLIHAEPDAASQGVFARLWRRLPVAARRRPPPCTGVSIEDLKGRSFYDAADACSLIELPLPAGTYHVTVLLGAMRTCYTLTLEQGTAFDLHLRRAGRALPGLR